MATFVNHKQKTNRKQAAQPRDSCRPVNNTYERKMRFKKLILLNDRKHETLQLICERCRNNTNRCFKKVTILPFLQEVQHNGSV